MKICSLGLESNEHITEYKAVVRTHDTLKNFFPSYFPTHFEKNIIRKKNCFPHKARFLPVICTYLSSVLKKPGYQGNFSKTSLHENTERLN